MDVAHNRKLIKETEIRPQDMKSIWHLMEIIMERLKGKSRKKGLPTATCGKNMQIKIMLVKKPLLIMNHAHADIISIQ